MVKDIKDNVKDINSAFEYCLGLWKLNECKTLCNIPKETVQNT